MKTILNPWLSSLLRLLPAPAARTHQRARCVCYEVLMPLYLITYQSDGRLAGMAVVFRVRGGRSYAAVSGFGDASLHQVHTLDPESAAAVPERLLGRVLSRTEATKLLHRMAHAVGQVQP
jgi:hypothetical protein